MACEQYKSIRFTAAVEDLIAVMNTIIEEYIEQGFRLTVRQLYYQLVARDIVPNTELSYKRVTGIANDGRLAGLIDWDVIEDRTRSFVRRGHWDTGRELLEQCATGFHMDMWANQAHRPFVIIEKEALVGVLEGVCNKYDVPVLAARGYPSSTVLREFAVNDILPGLSAEQHVPVIHLGDHDPSGIDMTRDLQERLSLFVGNDISLKRIALNMRQIEERKPPPNPAKTTDSRFASYVERFGNESWELDALPPQYIVEIVEKEIKRYIDVGYWADRQNEIVDIRTRIHAIAEKF